VLIRFLVVCLIGPYRRNSDISYILGQVSVDSYISLWHYSTEKRPGVPNEEFVTVWGFKRVIFVRELLCATSKIRLYNLSEELV